MKTQTAYIPSQYGETIQPGWVFFVDGKPRQTDCAGNTYTKCSTQYFRPVEVPVSEPEPVKLGIELIKYERARQISEEGWTPEHDDTHTDEGLARAAACYAVGDSGLFCTPSGDGKHYVWPWGREWWKPTPGDRIRELTKAGALICAEIDRLIRAQNYDPTPYCAVCLSRTAAGCSCPKQSKPEPVKVPLGPEDVPPGSVFRWEGSKGFWTVTQVTHVGVWMGVLGVNKLWLFSELFDSGYEISRDFGKTWEPCWKEVAQ